MTIKVTINEVEYGLTFGMIAVEELQLRQLERMSKNITTGNTRALTDMFFCAHNNYAELNEFPLIKYAKAAELVELILTSKDTETEARIVDAFTKSSATEDLMEKFKSDEPEDKKKIESEPTSTE